MFMFQTLCIRKRETIIPTICLCSRHCVSEREKLSYQRYVYVLDIVYQKEGNCVMPTICLCSRHCVSERGKLCLTYNVCRLYIGCIKKRKTYYACSMLMFFFYQKEGNCILPTSCLSFRFRVSERGNLHHTYSMFMFQIL